MSDKKTAMPTPQKDVGPTTYECVFLNDDVDSQSHQILRRNVTLQRGNDQVKLVLAGPRPVEYELGKHYHVDIAAGK